MNRREHLAIIGSGASTIYLLKHLLDESKLLKPYFHKISIFEKSRFMGMGMPYNPETTDRFNMSNISSEELPELTMTFADWLRVQNSEVLKSLDLENVEISESEVYSRLALGQYLHSQYKSITAQLSEKGIEIREFAGCKIIDVKDHAKENQVTLVTSQGTFDEFDKVIISTGHYWAEDDKPEQGYYVSPWPISKLMPKKGSYHNFEIGTLGASLSAFDVISSLSHRHGDFVVDAGQTSYHPHPGTEKFKIVMHSSSGVLPHLQFDQVEPFREIYRHVSRDEILNLVDERGFLRIETYFDEVCRPALIKAFRKDKQDDVAKLLEDDTFSMLDFVEKMSDEHDYFNAFEGMRLEMVEAEKSVLHHQPIHWKEVLDDLMYTLNFHAALMPAEDHLTLHSKVMPFLMNVIAAMPLPSGNTILALNNAGKLDIVSGKVTITEKQSEKGQTTITVKDGESGNESTLTYKMFIDCSGQKPLELENYPFQDLVKSGTVRKARAPFKNPQEATSLPEEKKAHLCQTNGKPHYQIGGIDIDGTYRLIGNDGESNPRIYDIAFPHVSGLRPYSYGLQACNHTAAILVQSWIEEVKSGAPVEDDAAETTELYEEL